MPTSTQATPGPRAMMSHLRMVSAVKKTPLAAARGDALLANHAARSKYRTPMQQTNTVRVRAVSADRFQHIVPKVNPETPISILRHARAGEVAFSVTGSPIVPAK
jgi:hypothetical protein